MVKWLAQQAEGLGVEIFAGFAAAEVLYNEDGAVKGVATGNMGIGKDGEPTEAFQPGVELHAKYTVFAEGSRGHLGRRLIDRFKLADGRDPQSYGIGLKELWEVDAAKHQPGLVVHTAGWPLDVGYLRRLVHLPRREPPCRPRFRRRARLSQSVPVPLRGVPAFQDPPRDPRHLRSAASACPMARAPSRRAGILSLPKTVFPGGALVGCEAGYLNASRIKGSHAAIKTGMLAADAAFDALQAGRQHDELSAYPQAFEASWLKRSSTRPRTSSSGSRRDAGRRS